MNSAMEASTTPSSALAHHTRTPWGAGSLIGVIVTSLVIGVPASIGTEYMAGRALSAGTPTADTLVFCAGSVAFYGVICIALYVWILRRYRGAWPAMSARRRGPLTYLALLPVAVFLEIAGGFIERETSNIVMHGQIVNTQADQIAALLQASPIANVCLAITLVIIAPFVEETLFRGAIFHYVRGRVGVVSGAIISGALFAMAHLSPPLFPELFFLGVAFALVVHITGSLYSSMFLHAINNAFVLVVILNSGLVSHP